MSNINADDQKRFDEVAAQFAKWRESKGNARERIPSELLDKARSLTPVFSKGQICKRLKLASASLKPVDAQGPSTANPAEAISPTDGAPTFAEVSLPQRPLSIEIHLPSGATVTLSNFTAMPPLALIQHLLGDSLC